MTEPTNSSPSLASLPDTTLSDIIDGLKDGSLVLPDLSQSDCQRFLRAALTEAARRKALRLADELGDEHPEAFVAILQYVKLANPAAMKRALEDSGVTLPAPTHVDDNGNPFYDGDVVSDALGIPRKQLQALVPEFQAADSELHRIQ